MGSTKRLLLIIPLLLLLNGCATSDEEYDGSEETADLSQPEDFSDEEVVSDDSDAPTSEEGDEEKTEKVADNKEKEEEPQEEQAQEEEVVQEKEEPIVDEFKEEEPQPVAEAPVKEVPQEAKEITPVSPQPVASTPVAPPPKEEPQSEKTALANFINGQTKFSGRRISIEAQDEDLLNVFRLISEESGVNLVVDDEVRGKITIKLRKIPWDQALTVIMKAKGLGYVRDGNILRISSLEKLKHEADLAAQLVESRNKTDPLKVKVIPISYANVSDLRTQSQNFLSERGKIAFDNRTNSLIVTDIASVADRVLRLVKTLDVPPEQVLIEGKIVEAQDGFRRTLGVQWATNGVPTQIGSNSKSGPVNMTPSLSISPSAVARGGFNLDLRVGSLDYFGDLTAALALSESEEQVRVVSSPRITTMNREKAEISQVLQVPIETVTIASAAAPAQKSIRFEPAELKLDVVPQITADGSVIMELDVKREFFSGATGEQQVRAKNSRSAKTKVTVRSGQTAVIGGIYDNQETNGESGVPWLRKIPVLGWLFKGRSTTRDKNELMIFLTPRILSRADSAEEGR